jgi:hypothetical protein
MMKPTTAIVGITALAALFAALPTHACDIVRTPFGLRITNCNLSELYKGRYDQALEFIPNRNGLQLRFPNLVPTDLDTFVINTGVNVGVDVENDGNGNALTFEVALVGTVHDPLNNGAAYSTTPLPPQTISGLAAGAGIAVGTGTLFLPNRNQDWDVCLMATIDPPPAGGQAWGRVYESNEADNLRTGCCRVYGPTPDMTGPPAC